MEEELNEVAPKLSESERSQAKSQAEQFLQNSQAQ
jgi:hypothetical protein